MTTRLDPEIDCETCRRWAVHCAADLEPAFAFGRWHHPAHAEELLRERHRARVVGPSIALPSGELLPVSDEDEGGETH